MHLLAWLYIPNEHGADHDRQDTAQRVSWRQLLSSPIQHFKSIKLFTERFAAHVVSDLLMLCVSPVITVCSSRETAGLKLSMRTMASPGDESETNSTEQGACWHPHLQITWIKVLQQAEESTEEDHSQGGDILRAVKIQSSLFQYSLCTKKQPMTVLPDWQYV